MLKLSYIALSLLMTVVLLLIAYYAINKSISEKKEKTHAKIKVLIGLLLWHLYLYIMGSSGLLADLSFPPKFVLVVILPVFVFTGVFLYKKRKSRWIQSIPYHWLAAYQSFRVGIETIFVFTVAAGLLHKNVTIEGYNYDMIFGMTAIAVALAAYYSKSIPKKLLIIWNYAGLIVIAIIMILFMTTIYRPEIYGPDTAPFPPDFGYYPYALVPGFLMPSAVFIHVLSLVQLKFYKVEK